MFKILTIPFEIKIQSFDDELLNRIILNKQLKSHSAKFFQIGEDVFWTVLLEYDPLIRIAKKHTFMRAIA